MAQQPILNDTVSSFGSVELYTTVSAASYDVDSTEVDDAHIHSCYEIYLNVSGDVSFLHDSTVYDVRHADVIVSHPGDVHHCIYRSSCVHEHICIWFQSAEVGDFLHRRGIRGKIRPTGEEAERLLRLACALSDAERDPFRRAADFTDLLMILDTNGAADPKSGKEPPSRIDRMLSYIDGHLLSISGSDELARVFYISESTVQRLFKHHVGVSVGKLIETKRLSHAEKMLRADRSVADACYGSGFSDCSRFILCFKKKFGKTPLKYKQDLFAKK